MTSSPGSTPASDSSFAGTNTMNLGIAVLLSAWIAGPVPSGPARTLRSIITTNDARPDRHPAPNSHRPPRLSLSLVRPCFPRTLAGYRTARNGREDHPRQTGGDRCAHPPPGRLVGPSGDHVRGARHLRRLQHVGRVPERTL